MAQLTFREMIQVALKSTALSLADGRRKWRDLKQEENWTRCFAAFRTEGDRTIEHQTYARYFPHTPPQSMIMHPRFTKKENLIEIKKFSRNQKSVNQI